jgi:hypothetical protein
VSKRPVEAMDTAPGIDAHNKTSQRDRRPQKQNKENPGHVKSVSQATPPRGVNHAPSAHAPVAHPVAEDPTRFSFRGPSRGHDGVLEDAVETVHRNRINYEVAR